MPSNVGNRPCNIINVKPKKPGSLVPFFPLGAWRLDQSVFNSEMQIRTLLFEKQERKRENKQKLTKRKKEKRKKKEREQKKKKRRRICQLNYGHTAFF